MRVYYKRSSTVAITQGERTTVFNGKAHAVGKLAS